MLGGSEDAARPSDGCNGCAGAWRFGQTRPLQNGVIKPAEEIEETADRDGGDGVDQQSGKRRREEGAGIDDRHFGETAPSAPFE